MLGQTDLDAVFAGQLQFVEEDFGQLVPARDLPVTLGLSKTQGLFTSATSEKKVWIFWDYN